MMSNVEGVCVLQGRPLPVAGVCVEGAPHAGVRPLLCACGAGYQRIQHYL